MPFKKLFLALFMVAILGIVMNNSTVFDMLFLPEKPLYFTVEWKRSCNVFLRSDERGRIEARLQNGLEKLNEIQKITKNNGDIKGALTSYLIEIENLKLASLSLKGANDGVLANKVIREAYFERKALAEVLKADVLDSQNYALKSSFGNFVYSALYLGEAESIFVSMRDSIGTRSEMERIKEWDTILVYPVDNALKEKILLEELKIASERMSRGFVDNSEQNYFESKIAGLQRMDFYLKWVASQNDEKKKKMVEEIVAGSWIDKIIDEALGEEVEPLQSFKSNISSMTFEELDQKIDGLEVYDETKEKLKEAKNAIVTSVYGIAKVEQVMGVLQEEKNTGKMDISPAGAYCIRMGYKIEQRENDGVAYNACVSEDGKECEDLAFYKGECQFEN